MSKSAWRRLNSTMAALNIAEGSGSGSGSNSSSSSARSKGEVVAAAVTRLQAKQRATLERRKWVARVATEGKLVALPGTIQGRSGWYETGGDLCGRFEMSDPDGAGRKGGFVLCDAKL